MANDIECRNAARARQFIQRNILQVFFGKELHRGIEYHPLPLRIHRFHCRTDAPTALARAGALNVKYCAARSRPSTSPAWSRPVRIARATRCADTITGVMPPPGCVQCPVRYTLSTGV